MAIAAERVAEFLVEDDLDRLPDPISKGLIDVTSKTGDFRLDGGRLGHGVTLLFAAVAMCLATRRLRHFSFSTDFGADPAILRREEVGRRQ